MLNTKLMLLVLDTNTKEKKGHYFLEGLITLFSSVCALHSNMH